MATTPQQNDINRDLGLGSRVSQESHERFLNRDGSFNVRRNGLPFHRTLNPYHALLTMSWVKFFVIVAIAYFITNISFAFAYMLCGPDALHGLEGYTFERTLLEAFFFSVQTLATIGYGHISPNNMAANIVVTVEALVGLLGFALATGLLFARFSRPSASIMYSNKAVIAPYRGITGFMFRIANGQSNELIEVNATVTLARNETDAMGKLVRKFYSLTLEREKVVFFPLHWIIVHPIDQSSPLYGMTNEQFNTSRAEILILLTAVDETFFQTVHSRSSYRYDEVVWNAKFTDVFMNDNGRMAIDLRKINDIEFVK